MLFASDHKRRADEKAMIRSRYNRMAHPAQDTKREMNTNPKNGINTTKAESQEDSSSFPAYGHLAIINKPNETLR